MCAPQDQEPVVFPALPQSKGERGKRLGWGGDREQRGSESEKETYRKRNKRGRGDNKEEKDERRAHVHTSGFD